MSSSPSLATEDSDIKEEFYRIAGFPNVIGAVDCTHKDKSPLRCP
ncbi:hypothetical protein R3I93_014947 [Phoxinus phoxinus]|uniref:Uncharacterized protein n=1 Tax=Phoxinus phoxinus TaxID=58324 RepID=A0AAN9H3D9_9TELE